MRFAADEITEAKRFPEEGAIEGFVGEYVWEPLEIALPVATGLVDVTIMCLIKTIRFGHLLPHGNDMAGIDIV